MLELGFDVVLVHGSGHGDRAAELAVTPLHAVERLALLLGLFRLVAKDAQVAVLELYVDFLRLEAWDLSGDLIRLLGLRNGLSIQSENGPGQDAG